MTFWQTKDEFSGSTSLPYGIKTSHTWHEMGQILRIINDYEIETFVELGVHVGGLASLLLPITKYKNFTYFGIEKDVSIIHPAIRDRIYIGDILESVDEVRRIKMSRRTFIYCDGGNKKLEMGLYKDLLNTGDIIACHDYFRENIIGLDIFAPEVSRKDLLFLEYGLRFEPLPDYALSGTRIMGFIKL